MNKYACVLIFFLAVLALCSDSRAKSSPYVKVLEKSATRIILEWTSPDLTWEHFSAEQATYSRPRLGTLSSNQPAGFPQLPTDAVLFELGGQSYSVTIVDSLDQMLNTNVICPVPTIQYNVEQDLSFTRYLENDAIYHRDQFYPSKLFELEQGAFFQNDFLRLQINPLHFNPVGGKVRWIRYLKIQLTFEPATVAEQQQRTKRKIDEAIRKQVDAQMGQSIQPNPLFRSMINTQTQERVKISLVDNGVYAIAGSDLSRLGVDLGTIDPTTIQIRSKETEIPCKIVGEEDGDFNDIDQILFYAQRLSGLDQYYNAFSDTNVYWLSWNEDSGMRYQFSSSSESPNQVTTFRDTLHFEKDLEYYQGDSNSDIQNSFDVDGEGWVWDRAIDPGETFQTTFDLPGYSMGQRSVHCKLRVRGETLDYLPDAHHLQAHLNHTLVYDTFFDDRDELILDLALDVDLKEIGNLLEIKSIKQADRQSRFYFDWFEISYERRTSTGDGWLLIKSADAVETAFRVDGFSSSEITVWDVESFQEIDPQSINQSWIADITVQSAGLDDGNYAEFYLNNEMIFSGGRGISFVAIDFESGSILSRKSFDTYGNVAQSDSLIAFINSLQQNTLVLAAIKDDGANSLSDKAIQTLTSKLASRTIETLSYRDSWAFIGKVGSSTPIEEQHISRNQGSASVATQIAFQSGNASFNVQFVPNRSTRQIVVFDPEGIKDVEDLQLLNNDFVTSISGADYVIITHRVFTEQAERLANHRRQMYGFETAVISVSDIYNAFNYGIKSPEALREFVKHAVLTWNPKPRYLLLFGDASWDIKGNIHSAPYKDFVPAIGNPVSDALIVCLDGDDDFLPDLSVGRLPVKTDQEAQAMIDKIIEYEQNPGGSWTKRFLFISGGLDESEQTLFSKQSQNLAQDYVESFPTFGQALFITKEENHPNGDPRSQILNTMNKGVIWSNFIGHAASRTWELMFNNPDVDELSNQGYYPVISSMTCHTGRFAEPTQQSFGEKFLLAQQKGAIGFWGTSGWGYSYEDYQYLRELFPTILADSLRQLGDVILLTKFALWKKYGSGAHYRNLILQYNLLGDPATTLVLPVQPDLTVMSGDLSVTPETLSEADSTATLHLKIQNWGLATVDSVDIELNIHHVVTQRHQKVYFRLPPIGAADSLSYFWSLKDMAGPVEITVVLDPQNSIPEANETNNNRTFQITVLASTITPIAPFNHSLMSTDNVVLKIQTPQQIFDDKTYYTFELDTVPEFNSPSFVRSQTIQAHPLVVKWKPENLRNDQTYFWRVRNENNLEHSLFVFEFRTHDTFPFGWYQTSKSPQHQPSSMYTKWESDGGQLDWQQIVILLQSAWTNSVGFAVIEINEHLAMQTGRGYNIVVLNEYTGEIIETGHFDTYGDPQAAPGMAAFIESIPTGRIVLVAVSDEGRVNMNEAAWQALESIGSSRIRDLQFRDMWAIIGLKGAPIGSVLEQHLPAAPDGAVVLKDTLEIRHPNGFIKSERIGPATKWHSIDFEYEMRDSSEFTLDIYGYRSAGNDSVRLFESMTQSPIDLSSLDAENYPFLRLFAHMSSYDGKSSPLLKNWTVAYNPSPDIALTPHLFTQSADTIIIGQSGKFLLDVYNIGLTDVDSVRIIFEEENSINGRSTFAEFILDSIETDKYIPIEQPYSFGSTPGQKQIYITVDPDQRIQEMSEGNNSLHTTVFVQEDTLKPQIKLFFDDREIFDGDMVTAQPIIRAQLFDNNPSPIDDTTRINLYLDGRRISFGDDELLSLKGLNSGDMRAELRYTPVLDDGEHQLDIYVSDISNNRTEKTIGFKVYNHLVLENVLNYPNPFDESTEFFFESSQYANIEIKIYTVAGRLIRTLESMVGVGHNAIFWDGRDQEGDRPANGVYLYKIKATSDQESVTVLSKVIVMR